jgi:hypothetical protein
MKMQIVRDAKGNVVSTAEVSLKEEAVVEFELEEGHTVEETEAPRLYHLDLVEFYKKRKK